MGREFDGSVIGGYVGYRVVRDRGCQWTALSQATRLLPPDNNAPFAPGAAGGGRACFFLDPARIGAAGVYYRVFASALSTNVDSAVTFTVGLYPISAPAGAAGTVSVTAGTVIAGSTVALTPGANGSPHSDSGDFAAPAAGWYALGVAMSGAMAASSDVDIRAELLARRA